LIEALVSITIVAVLMALLGNMLVNINRTEARLTSYLEDNRQSFYSIQQLRRLVKGISAKRSLVPNDKFPLFSASEDSIRGHMFFSLFNETLLQPFEMNVVSNEDGAFISVTLQDEREFEIRIPYVQAIELNYLDSEGAVHDVWPPKVIARPLDEFETNFKAEELIPEAILFRITRIEGEETIVCLLYG
jgi:hypothetical protein